MRQGDLNSGEHVAERLLCGETDNDARDSGRGENACAELPDGIEQHQDGTGRDDDDGGDDDFANHRHLRVNFSRGKIIFCVQSMPAQERQLHGVDAANDQERKRDDEQNAETFLRHPGPFLRQFQQRQQENDAEQRNRETQRLAGYRNNHFAEHAVGALCPKVHSFFNRKNRAEHEPEKSDDLAGVNNSGECAGPEDARRAGSDAIDDRHQRKGAANDPNEKRERFSNGRRANREPGLLFFRLEQPRASPNDPKKPARNQCEKAETGDARQQAHPCYAIEKRSSQKLAARVFRDLIEPSAISSAGTINL